MQRVLHLIRSLLGLMFVPLRHGEHRARRNRPESGTD
jgi:hypothetical protein